MPAMQDPEFEPDFHFLALAPGLQADWFLIAARRYWQRFRPTVVGDLRLVAVIPPDKRVAITTLARSDTASVLRDQINASFPGVSHDDLVSDSIEDMQAVLDMRAELGRRFG